MCRSEERKATSSPRPGASKPSSLTTSSSSPAAERKSVPKPESSPSRDDVPRPSLARY